MDLENLVTASSILEARKSASFLKEMKIIRPDEYEKICISIDKKEKDECWFITKPFRNNDSMGRTSWNLMDCLIRKCKKGLLHEDK